MTDKPVTKLPVQTEKSALPQKVGREWAPYENLRREVDRLFDDFHPFSWRLPSAFFAADLPRLPSAAWRQPAPAMDVTEKEDSYEVTAELPGLEEKDVEIKLTNDTLTIKGEKKQEKEESGKDYYLSERRYGFFQRSVLLPDGIDTDKIEASFAKGILTVKLPKTPEAKSAEKVIPIKAAS